MALLPVYGLDAAVSSDEGQEQMVSFKLKIDVLCSVV